MLDPATGDFTPSADDAAKPGRTLGRTATIGFKFSGEFSRLDTVDCLLALVFGNQTRAGFFSNHSVSVAFSFEAGAPPTHYTIPFSYTPNGNGTPYVEVNIFCTDHGADGNVHAASDVVKGNLPAGSFLAGTDVTF